MVSENPASNLYIRGVKRSIPHPLLDYSQLQTIYDSYLIIDERTHRNKVMLSLLIFQGITSSELAALLPAHLDLSAGQLLMKASKHRNGRILPLLREQIVLLNEYIRLIRPRLLIRKNLTEKSVSGQLFFSSQGSPNLTNTLMALFKELRKEGIWVRNGPHIRMSVLSEWLKVKDVRLVQHMAGHKYISSTERYGLSHLPTL